MHIPIEVCEQIIDYCWGTKPWRYDDHATLWACALTCRSWYPRSHTLLYRNIVLTSGESLDRLTLSLFARQENGRLVQQLRIRPKPGSKNMHTWVGIVPLRLFKMLTNMHTLSLMHVSTYLIRSSEFHLGYSQFKTVHTLSLRFVSFTSFADFSRFICNFPALRNLQLTPVPVSRNDPEIMHDVRRGPRLHSLRLGDLAISSDGRALINYVNWMLLSSSPGSIKSIVFRITTDDLVITRDVKRSVGMMLKKCGPILEDLTLDFTVNEEWTRNDGVFTFERNTGLRSVQLELTGGVLQEGHIRWLAQLFHSLPSAPLERITVRFTFQTSARGVRNTSSESWGTLTSAMTRSTFGRLGEAKMHCVTADSSLTASLDLLSPTSRPMILEAPLKQNLPI
ncbi:hypothetical protein EUX98_g3604 [Antrodiella citrinella]|uniref:F-box domain-containing protein n=1 Tax=Antrodiella citrinella TaxID=2447956 RepID=A0A4S4MW56_9APHY|nr:hypothetical protein EUX98_g3604 [Antrodiella citrinella]